MCLVPAMPLHAAERHCEHYVGRGVMRHFKSGRDLADDMNINVGILKKTFDK